MNMINTDDVARLITEWVALYLQACAADMTAPTKEGLGHVIKKCLDACYGYEYDDDKK
jgi:hypothetical protein